jgi:hypothetical protein
MRTGDGSHPSAQEINSKDLIKSFIMNQTVDSNGNVIHNEEDSIWGFNDEMISEEDKKFIKIINQHVA